VTPMGTSSVKTDEMIEKWVGDCGWFGNIEDIEFFNRTYPYSHTTRLQLTGEKGLEKILRDTALHFLALGRKQGFRAARIQILDGHPQIDGFKNKYPNFEDVNLDELAEVE